jgi:hypothetical protein
LTFFLRRWMSAGHAGAGMPKRNLNHGGADLAPPGMNADAAKDPATLRGGHGFDLPASRR